MHVGSLEAVTVMAADGFILSVCCVAGWAVAAIAIASRRMLKEDLRFQYESKQAIIKERDSHADAAEQWKRKYTECVARANSAERRIDAIKRVVDSGLADDHMTSAPDGDIWHPPLDTYTYSTGNSLFDLKDNE